jgi:hypothetical protein
MAKIHLTGRRPHRDGINTRLDNGRKCGAQMAHIMRTEGVPGTSFLVEGPFQPGPSTDNGLRSLYGTVARYSRSPKRYRR